MPFGGWGGVGVGQPWTCPWVDVHGMSMVGCHNVDMDATDKLFLLLCSPCCTLFFWKDCLLPAVPCVFDNPMPKKKGPTIVPPTIIGACKNAKACCKWRWCKGVKCRKCAVAAAATAGGTLIGTAVMWLVSLPPLCSLPPPPPTSSNPAAVPVAPAQHLPILLLFLQPKTWVPRSLHLKVHLDHHCSLP